MALSKHYQFYSIESLLRILTKQIAIDTVQTKTIMKIVNKNTLDIAEMLNGATAPDYGTVLSVGDSSVHYSLIKNANSYVDATRIVTVNAGHGLTNSSIGKKIILSQTDKLEASDRVGLSVIESILSPTTFRILNQLGGNMSPCIYGILSFNQATNIDLSNYKIDKIIKLTDSLNGLVIKSPDFNFENLDLDDNYNSLYYNHFGESLFLFKGRNITTFGNLELYYYRLPILIEDENDYIDMKDKHIPLLIDKCKLEIYELANLLPPKELTQSVESKTQLIREANQSKLNTMMSNAK